MMQFEKQIEWKLNDEIRSLSADATLSCKYCGQIIYPIDHKFADPEDFYGHDDWSINMAYQRHMKKCIEAYRLMSPPPTLVAPAT